MKPRHKSVIKWVVIAAILFSLIRWVLRLPCSAVLGISMRPVFCQSVWAVLGTVAVWLCAVLYRTSARAKELGDSLRAVRESVIRLEQRVAQQNKELKDAIAELRFENIKRDGKFRFTKDTKLTEALELSPRVSAILFSHGLACISCPAAQYETIEQAAQVHGMDVGPILDDLNKLLEE